MRTHYDNRITSLSVNKGEYEIVANDFARARSLFDGTKVEAFEKGMYITYLLLVECSIAAYCSVASS